MNDKVFKKALRVLLLAVTALAVAAAPSFGATFNLSAGPTTLTMPDGAPIPMWGFACESAVTPAVCPDPGVVTVPGPELRVPAGDTTLTINLTNNLSESVSFFVPGLRAASTTGTAGKFTGEVGAAGTAQYTFNLTGRAGTYLYHSATDRIRTHVPMGLYGALVVEVAVGEAYPGVTYDQDQVLVFSAIDPALNAAPATFDGAKVINWNPQYFLINGQAYSPANPPISINTSQNVLLRFVNAGLETFAPTLGGGLYMNLIAEDGNLYPHPIEQYGLELTAGKTIDAMINAGSDGTYALYDRALHLTNGGMLVNIQAGAAACSVDTDCDDGLFCNGTETCVAGSCQAGTPPVCDDGIFCTGAETCNETTDTCDPGTPLTCDDGVGCTVDSCNEDTDSCDNLPDNDACPDDTLFCNGTEFCDAALDCSSTGDPCLTGETCNETTNTCDAAPNIAPFANNDVPPNVPRGSTNVIINVTDNDVDPDGTIDVATVVITTGSNTQRGGTVVANGDGTVTYNPPNPGFRGTDTFQYTVNDDDGATSNVATVSVNVVK